MKSKIDYSGGKIHQKIQKQSQQEYELVKRFKPIPIKSLVTEEQFDMICEIQNLEVKIALTQEQLKVLKVKAKELKITPKMVRGVRFSRMY